MPVWIHLYSAHAFYKFILINVARWTEKLFSMHEIYEHRLVSCQSFRLLVGDGCAIHGFFCGAQ